MDMSFRPAATPPLAHPGILARTFAEAATSYIEHGGQAQYLRRIVDRIGDRAMTEIFPFDVKQLASELYPEQKNSTRNRCVITPVRAVVYHAYDRGWGPAIRLRNLKEDPPKRKKAASQPWLHAFFRQCASDGLPHLEAIIMFMSQTGARVSEAVSLQWGEVDLMNRTALLLKTKTGANSTRFLTDQLISRLYELKKGRESSDRVFRYRNRHAVNERIKAVCGRAKIAYKPSHTCGRHAFANIALSMGIDIKSTMTAGGWKSTAVFLGTYANPHNAGRVVAERFNAYQYDADL
jgi:integrase